MWNFFIPDTLKQYIDHIVQPHLTFDPRTYAGLVVGKPAVIVRSAGGSVATSADTGLAYLSKALQFIGFSDIRHIAVGGTANRDGRASLLELASQEAANVAEAFVFDPALKPALLPALAHDAKPSELPGSPAPASSLGRSVLLVSASPLAGSSASLAAATAFLEEYKKSTEDVQVTTVDLAALVESGSLPPYSALRVQAKFTKYRGAGTDLAADVAAEWAYCEERIKELVQADTIVFAVPMWNLSLPYSLALYLHHVVQPNYTFDPATWAGLLPKGKRAFVVAASGGPSLGGGNDFLTPYMKQVLRFMGIEDVHVAHICGTAGAGRSVAIDQAVQHLKSLANI